MTEINAHLSSCAGSSLAASHSQKFLRSRNIVNGTKLRGGDGTSIHKETNPHQTAKLTILISETFSLHSVGEHASEAKLTFVELGRINSMITIEGIQDVVLLGETVAFDGDDVVLRPVIERKQCQSLCFLARKLDSERRNVPVSGSTSLFEGLLLSLERLGLNQVDRAAADVDDDASLVGRRRAVPVDRPRVPHDEISNFRLDLDHFYSRLSVEPLHVLFVVAVAAKAKVSDEHRGERAKEGLQGPVTRVLSFFGSTSGGKELFLKVVGSLDYDQSSVVGSALGEADETLSEFKLESRASKEV